MADNQLSQVTAGKTGFVSQVNQYFSALTVNFLPRSIAGTVADLAGTVGETTRRWSNGFFKVFTVKGNNSSLIFKENVTSEQIEILSDTSQIVKTTDESFIGKTRANRVTDNADFSIGDVLVSIVPLSANQVLTLTVKASANSIIHLGSALPASITNCTDIGADLYISDNDNDKIITVTNYSSPNTSGVYCFEYH